MKLSILRYIISIVIAVISFSAIAQENIPTDSTSVKQVVSDSIKYKDQYGLRIGIDISKPIVYLINNDIKGFEVVADYRIKKNIYIATELGYYDRYTDEDYMNFSTTGPFIKIGANYNLYQNWLGMSNEIYLGMRYGFSTFEHHLYEYTPNFYGTYFDEVTYEVDKVYENLNAHWVEFVVGLKVEVLNNFYMGASIAFKKMVKQKQPTNFLNMYVPGFDRVYLNDTGFGFNYTLTYAIPFFKKDK